MSSSDSDEDVRCCLRKKHNIQKQEKDSCSKLVLPDHLAAFMEERELDRDIEPIECNKEIIEIIFSNYVIVKNVLSHLRWQEKLICKVVCRLWNSAVNRLQYEQLGPVEFSVNLGARAIRKGVKLLKSTEFYTEPMAIFTFCNTAGLNVYTIGCEDIVPSPCSPACDKKHSIIDMVYQETTAPRDCMYAVKASSISYLPLPQSRTIENSIRKLLHKSEGFLCGIYIPKIPGVEFHIIDINSSDGIERELIPELKRLTESNIVKGVVACLTDNYLLSHMDVENAEYLEFLNAMQPNVPFAFGGCLVEDTANIGQEMASIVDSVNKGKEFISGNTMSLGLFLTPKADSASTDDNEGSKSNFEIYSYVIEAAEWSKQKIKQAIQEFSERVPRFEHSVAIKFSCTGREQKHETEQFCFRTFFPNTPLAGCFGNGELGVNHPKRKPRPAASKRPREEQAYDKVHSYSTVFFYIGWGKITEEAERDD